MASPIYIPRNQQQTNPATQFAWQMVQNMAITNQRMKLLEQQTIMEDARDKRKKEEERVYNERIKKEDDLRKFRFNVAEKGGVRIHPIEARSGEYNPKSIVQNPIDPMEIYLVPEKEEAVKAVSYHGQFNGKPVKVEGVIPGSRFEQDVIGKGLTRFEEIAEKSPKSAMEKFLQDNPNATPDQMAEFSQKLKGPGTQFTYETPEGGKVSFSQGMPTTGKIAQKEVEDLRNLEVTTKGLIDTSTKILTDLSGDPTLIGTTGWAQRTIDSIGSQVEGLVDKVAPKAGIKIKAKAPESFNWKNFKSDAVKSAAIKSRVIKMAYAIARLREPGARQFSDADIQRAIDEIGAATGSPDQMQGVIQNIQLDAIKAIDIQSRQTLKRPYAPEGLTEETIQHGAEKGLSRDQVILLHLRKYGGQ